MMHHGGPRHDGPFAPLKVCTCIQRLVDGAREVEKRMQGASWAGCLLVCPPLLPLLSAHADFAGDMQPPAVPWSGIEEVQAGACLGGMDKLM